MIQSFEKISKESDLESIASDLALLPASHLMALGMTTCHSLNRIDGALIGDPLDVKCSSLQIGRSRTRLT